jgi:hypothetical protein
VQRMISDAGTTGALPLLAFALRELYEASKDTGRFTHSLYESRLGGIEGSVERAANTLMSSRDISVVEERAVRTAFLAMVRLDEEGRYLRSPARWKKRLKPPLKTALPEACGTSPKWI